MAVVTGIVPSARKEGRFDLQVDGRHFGVVSVEVIAQLALRVGLTVDDAADGALGDAVAALATYDRAVNMLAVQPRSARDLRRRLLAKKEPATHVDAAIVRLQESGVLDDSAFARQYARSRVLGAGHSRRRVQQELYKRGVVRDAIDGAVEEVFADEGMAEGELADAAARKKLRTLERLDPVVRRRRLYAFLARRGYEPDVIRDVMKRLSLATDTGTLDDVDLSE